MRTMEEIEYLNAENDALKKRIKELELALENSREHEKALRKCFEGHRKQIKELEADKLRQENYCESLVNENKRLNEIIISKDMVGAELHNENKELKQKLETRIAMWEHERNLRKEIAHDWAKAKDRLKELESRQPKWISVEDDEKPKEDEEILFTDGEFIYKGYWTTWEGVGSDFSYVVGSGFFDEVNDETFTEEQITHWMPFPKPPTTEESSVIEEGK